MMELLLFFSAIAAFFVIVFVREAYLARRREKNFIRDLYEKFGELPAQEISPERYRRIGSYYARHKKEGQIDDITWNDLGMDSIFKRINYTFSASGEEYLYYMLRTPAQSAEKPEHFEQTVEWFLEHPDARVKIQLLLSKLGHTGKYSLYDYLDNLSYLGKRSNKKHYITDALFVPALCILPFHYGLGIGGLAVLAVYNIMSYFKEKNEIEPYIISFAYVLRLLNTCDSLLKIKVPVLNREWEEIAGCTELLSGMKRGSFLVLSGTRGMGTGNPLDVIMDYVRMVFHVDLIKFNRMLSLLTGRLEYVDRLIGHVGYVEAAIAAGAFRTSLRGEFCIPEFSREKKFCIKDAYYPLLTKPVKNSIQTKRGVLITGSNASGKSTFLKTAAVNAILAQTLHTCTAESYSAPFFHIYSSMALRDDLESGESYYIVEIKALKRILDAAADGEGFVLCFVDEVLRGTNTIERIAAAAQILRSLAEDGTICFAATHDVEMTDLLKDFYDNYHFEEDITGGDLSFHYKLLSGKSTTRNAIRLLEIMGYDSGIIEKAMRQAERFAASGSWELT